MVRVQDPESWKVKGYELATDKKHKYNAVLEHRKTGALKKIPFGGKKSSGEPYPQFKDQLGHYREHDHNDEARRQRWLKRHAQNTEHKFSSAYFSRLTLW